MVCPNCKSKEIITVQDQHFCISCGQVVPEPAAKPSKTSGTVAVQANGLPEGVKILPVVPAGALSIDPMPAVEDPQPTVEKHKGHILTEKPADNQPRIRRKAGRPKAGRLDTPRFEEAASALPSSLPKAPPIMSVAPAIRPSRTPNTPPRLMDDIAPRKTPTPVVREEHPSPKPSRKRQSKAHHQVHKVGVPPLHYGQVLAFSARSRIRPRLLALAALGSASFGAAAAYGAWLILHGGLPQLATQLSHGGARLVAELVILGALYYIGRSIGQAAITFGVAREADQRPVSLSHQLGVGINSFGRRLTLDLAFSIIELVILAGGAALLFSGGASWPVNAQLQIAAIFGAYLLLLYLLAASAITRGLAGVALTLTTQTPTQAARLGWHLFSHRIELIVLKLLAALLELVMALPLAAIAAGFILAAPPRLHIVVALGVGLLAWLTGAFLGAGTAGWWAALYRRLVLVDHPNGAVTLLSGPAKQEAKRGPLILIIALSSFLVAAALAAPWLNLP